MLADFPAVAKPWASLKTTGTNTTKPEARGSPATRSENMSWGTLLPTLRLAPNTYTQFVCKEATRSSLESLETGCGQLLLGFRVLYMQNKDY